MFRPIWGMLIKEWILLLRDPKLRGIILFVPMIQTLLFGYAVTTDIQHVPTVLYDEDLSPASRRLVDAFTRSGYFDITSVIESDKALTASLDPPGHLMVLHIPPRFENQLESSKKPAVQILLDGTEANTARVAAGYVNTVFANFLKRSSENKKNEINFKPRAWFNPNLESRNFFIPGLTASVITLLTLTLTSMAIVREKEIGTMEQMLVSPITKTQFLIGKTLPFILVGLFDAAIVISIAVWFFEVPFEGSPFLLFFATCIYLLTALGSGLFISTISRTQQQALLGTFLFYFPLVLLSGYLFPVANMPLPIRYIAFINPLYYFLIIIRSIFLKGTDLTILFPELLILALIGLIIFVSAVARFKKQLQ